MGVVYRARDDRLERDVAIKVLPKAWADDPEHSRRFEREARLLGALSHQNVAHVYGFEETEDGSCALVLELIEGEDLAERLRRGPLSIDETLRICRQVAAGLEAAHELGVIHRDLKPGNVRITPEGIAKVIDFGLAKSIRPNADQRDSTPEADASFQTQAGHVVGTPTYMSPESVRGQRVDRRADIWAFGCVLYECLTGQPPLQGESLPDTLAAIVQREPDFSPLPEATPPAIRELIRRCLDKDPDTRLRDIGEARIALSSGLTPSTPVVAVVAERPPRRSASLPVRILIAVVVIAAIGWLANLYGPAPARPGFLEGATFTEITDFPGAEIDAAISRDGKFVAFGSARDGQYDAWVGQLGTESFRNVTQGRKTFWALKVRDIGFHVDGGHIWINNVAEGDYGLDQLFALPILGGEPRGIFRETCVNVEWSPDGKRAVYHTSANGDPV